MYHLNGYQNIIQNKITSAKHETLMVMLYDGMITRLKQAKERIESGYEVKAKDCIIRAMRIADALMDSLNMEEGGTTASDLERLYYFIISELSMASKGINANSHIDNALKILEVLLDGWKQLEERVLHGN